MALLMARQAGPQGAVLVDTGHHYQGQNIEQIVAWLLREKMLGGFHFNDRRYADDDLTLGSIDPYQVFRIFHELLLGQPQHGDDRVHDGPEPQSEGKNGSHGADGLTAQELFAKAALVDRERLANLQDGCRLVEAEECVREAFWFDVRPLIQEWRVARSLPADPLSALRASGYVERIRSERRERNARSVATYA